MTYIETLGLNAKKASVKIASASTGEKNVILENIAKALRENTDRIIEANRIDISKQKKTVFLMLWSTDSCLTKNA